MICRKTFEITPPVTAIELIVTGVYNNRYSYYYINDIKQTSSGNTYDIQQTLEKNDTLSFYINCASSGAREYCYISVNGTKMITGEGTYTLSDISKYKTINVTFMSKTLFGNTTYNVCEIVTT